MLQKLQLGNQQPFSISSLPSIFGNEQNKYLDYIKKMLLKSLCENSNETVCSYSSVGVFCLTYLILGQACSAKGNYIVHFTQ